MPCTSSALSPHNPTGGFCHRQPEGTGNGSREGVPPLPLPPLTHHPCPTQPLLLPSLLTLHFLSLLWPPSLCPCPLLLILVFPFLSFCPCLPVCVCLSFLSLFASIPSCFCLPRLYVCLSVPSSPPTPNRGYNEVPTMWAKKEGILENSHHLRTKWDSQKSVTSKTILPNGFGSVTSSLGKKTDWPEGDNY